MTHAIPFPNSKPTEVGIIAAAHAGNVDVLRVAADMLRDADRNADAAKLDLLAGEFESRCSQARQLRAILTASSLPDRHETKYSNVAEMREVRAFINLRGLPIECFAVMTNKLMPNGFLVLMPTDGREVESTANRLGEFLGSAFPASQFFVFAINRPLTAAGQEAEGLAESLGDDPRGVAA